MVPADVGTDRAVIDALETVEYTPESIPKEDAKYACYPPLSSECHWRCVVHLSLSFIHGLTLVLTFRFSVFPSLSLLRCGICLCDYAIGDTIRFLPCGHHFHASCVDVWLASHRTCPFCLHDVTDPTAPQWQHHTAQRVGVGGGGSDEDGVMATRMEMVKIDDRVMGMRG